jgi:hypothetical protein
LCDDLDMRIALDGTWYYHGSPIGRKELVRLFASVLRRDEAGDYWLVTPAERAPVRVDDAPFVAVRLERTGAGRHQVLTLHTNLDEAVNLDARHPLRVVTDAETGEPRPYVGLRDGLSALVNRPVFYELVGLGVEEQRSGEAVYGVWSAGAFFPLGRLEEAPP